MTRSIKASSDSVDGLTVPQLKKILKSKGLPVAGKKAVLLERLKRACDEVEGAKKMPSLTEAPQEPAKKGEGIKIVKAEPQEKTDKENFMEGTGRWTPLKSKAAIFSSEDDEDEDPYGDPFFMSELPNPNEWEGNSADGGSTAGEWNDWNEEANYFDEEEEEPDYSGYSADKSRGRELGSVRKGSSSLFPTREDYASMSKSRESSQETNQVEATPPKAYGLSSGYTPGQAAVPVPAPAPVSTIPSSALVSASAVDTETSTAPTSEVGIELGSGGALNPVEVIPPEALKSLLELEDRVTMLSSDVNELKIVNAALLITLFTVVYQFTRPIW